MAIGFDVIILKTKLKNLVFKRKHQQSMKWLRQGQIYITIIAKLLKFQTSQSQLVTYSFYILVIRTNTLNKNKKNYNFLPPDTHAHVLNKK